MQAKKTLCWVLIIAGALFIAGCDNDSSRQDKDEVKPGPNGNHSDSLKNTAKTPGASLSEYQQKTMQLTIYQADKTAHLVPETHVLPVDDHPAETAIKLLIAGTKQAEHISVAPLGTELLGINIKEHIAYVNFNDKLKTISGSAEELLLVGAIVNTLTEFPDIHKVQILINNQKVETLSGHMDLSQPLKRMEQFTQK